MGESRELPLTTGPTSSWTSSRTISYLQYYEKIKFDVAHATGQFEIEFTSTNDLAMCCELKAFNIKAEEAWRK